MRLGEQGGRYFRPTFFLMDDVAVYSAIFEVIVSLTLKPGEMWTLFCDNMIDSDKT